MVNNRLASSENPWSTMPAQTRTSRKPDHRNSFSKRTSRLAEQATSECLHKWWMETSSNGTPSEQRQSGHANTLHDQHKVKTTLTSWRIYCANTLQNLKDQGEHLVTQHIANRRAQRAKECRHTVHHTANRWIWEHNAPWTTGQQKHAWVEHLDNAGASMFKQN